MTLADLCLPAAVVIAVAAIGFAKVRGAREFDNARPRDPAFYKDPFRARALGAHQNSLESFPLFAAAVILAELRHASQPAVDALAAAFILIRIAYVAAYLMDKATLRSVLFSVGFLVNLGIFFAPVWAK